VLLSYRFVGTWVHGVRGVIVKTYKTLALILLSGGSYSEPVAVNHKVVNNGARHDYHSSRRDTVYGHFSKLNAIFSKQKSVYVRLATERTYVGGVHVS